MENDFKESWYLKNVTLGIFLLLVSWFPFASMLILPLFIWKSRRLMKCLNQNFIYIRELEIKVSEELKKAEETSKEMIASAERQITQLENSKTATLLDLDSKITNKEGIVKEIIAEANKEALQIEYDKQQILTELDNKIQNKTQLINKIIDDANTKATLETKLTIDNAKINLNNLETEICKKQSIIKDLDSSIKEKEAEIIELDEEKLLQSFAFYKPQYDFDNSEQYKESLNNIRAQQKVMITLDTAATSAIGWTVNGSEKEGKKHIKDTKKLLLRAFNSECDYVINKVKYNNFDSCKKRIDKSCQTICKLGNIMSIAISAEYYELKISELHLALEYQQKKQKEKEEQKEIHARMREEAKLQKEIEEARRDAEKERSHYSNAINKIKLQLEKCTNDDDKNIILEKLRDLEIKLNSIDEKLKDIDYREANQKAGYVYIISNIGSFGENIYKIGMTRRLDPMERVNELGDASVPFNFDVHALIFSDDAPKLEAALHKAFEKNKLNMVNARREFFKVSLSQIEHIIKENYDGTVEFKKTAEAEQYRESLKLKKEIA